MSVEIEREREGRNNGAQWGGTQPTKTARALEDAMIPKQGNIEEDKGRRLNLETARMKRYESYILILK